MDVLIGLATVVAFSATVNTGQMLYMVLIVGALVGIGLMLEPRVTAQPGSDVARQTSRSPAELEFARPGPAMARLDARLVEAMSA